MELTTGTLIGVSKRCVLICLLIAAGSATASACPGPSFGFDLAADDSYVYASEIISDPGNIVAAGAFLSSPWGRGASDYGPEQYSYSSAKAYLPINGEEGIYTGSGDAYDYYWQQDFPSGE